MPPPISLITAWLFSAAMIVAVLSAALHQPSAELGMAFYGSYHQNQWNQLIHFFGVPAILWSAIVFGCHLTTPLRIPSLRPLLPTHYFSVGTFLTLFYVLYYLSIDPIGACFFGPVLLGMYVTGVQWVAQDQQLASKKTDGRAGWTGTGAVLKWALAVQVASWYAQIHPGHAVLEGAKPALLDSLGASFSSAPLFAFYEGVWFLGLRKQLRDQVQELVKEHTVELCSGTGAAMRVCETLQ